MSWGNLHKTSDLNRHWTKAPELPTSVLRLTLSSRHHSHKLADVKADFLYFQATLDDDPTRPCKFSACTTPPTAHAADLTQHAAGPVRAYHATLTRLRLVPWHYCLPATRYATPCTAFRQLVVKTDLSLQIAFDRFT